MINGKYKASFEVQLSGMESKEEALEAIMDMLNEYYTKNELPDMELELLELEQDEEEDETDLVDELGVA